MEDLFFSYNWNNKLDCKALTTIRIYNPNKHVRGAKYRMVLKRTEEKGIGTIVDVKPFLLASLNPFMSYLDTGYGVEECSRVIERMFPKVDFTKVKLAFILIVKE